MKLFAFYIGGRVKGALVEVHDVRLCIGNKIEDCYEEIRRTWWGTPGSLHLDCWGELTSADGYNISLQTEGDRSGNKLWFVNLGGYQSGDFNELHKNVFVVAPDEAQAKIRALKQVRGWTAHHKDTIFDVEDLACADDLFDHKGLSIVLEPTENPVPFVFASGFNPAVRKVV